MRRSDREIKDRQEIIRVMQECDVCRLAWNEGEVPYIVPLNFGLQEENGQVFLYFHSAMEGHKLALIARGGPAAFEMDRGHTLMTDEASGNCTMAYESVIGWGRVEMVPDEQKYEALCVLMRHYRGEGFPFNQGVIPRTAVYRLAVEEMTGKRREKKM